MDTQPIIELAPNGLPRPDPMLSKWSLRQDVVHMDHGSSGACPTEILEYQNALRWDLDRGSPEFFLSAWSPRHRASKERLSKFVGADYDELLLTPGSTLGLNIVTQSQQFQPGDELLTTNHAYSSVTMLLKHVANRDGAKVVIANVPFPVASPDDIVASIMACVTERTKFAIIDHIVSRTGLVFPIKRIVAELAARGIDTLVDGAHGPGQVQVDLHDIGAAYYTTSCHKWMCAPRGVGFMYARRDRISKLKPLIIARSGHWRDTNGAGYTWLEHTFEWNGCHDPSGVHSMPKIIDFLDTALPGGHAAMVKRNHDLAVEARTRVLEILGIAKPCPDDMIANMVTFPLPDSVLPNALGILPICKNLWERERAEIQCYHWPAYPKRIFRFSVQLHNSLEQFLWLASKIKEELENETKLAASLQTGESSGDAVVQNVVDALAAEGVHEKPIAAEMHTKKNTAVEAPVQSALPSVIQGPVATSELELPSATNTPANENGVASKGTMEDGKSKDDFGKIISKLRRVATKLSRRSVANKDLAFKAPGKRQKLAADQSS